MHNNVAHCVGEGTRIPCWFHEFLALILLWAGCIVGGMVRTVPICWIAHVLHSGCTINPRAVVFGDRLKKNLIFLFHVSDVHMITSMGCDRCRLFRPRSCLCASHRLIGEKVPVVARVAWALMVLRNVAAQRQASQPRLLYVYPGCPIRSFVLCNVSPLTPIRFSPSSFLCLHQILTFVCPF